MAIKDYTKAISLIPNDSIAYENRGNTYQSIGKMDKACADWKKAYELGKASAGEKLKKYCK